MLIKELASKAAPEAPPGTKAVVLFLDENIAENLTGHTHVGVSIGNATETSAIVPEKSCTSG